MLFNATAFGIAFRQKEHVSEGRFMFFYLCTKTILYIYIILRLDKV